MAADLYITGPSLDLRYFCENWFDRLMGWVKYFYIPGLHYWHYDDCPGYKELSNSLDQTNRDEFNIDKMSEEMLDSLKSDFRKEVREWIERWGVHKDNGKQT